MSPGFDRPSDSPVAVCRSAGWKLLGCLPQPGHHPQSVVSQNSFPATAEAARNLFIAALPSRAASALSKGIRMLTLVNVERHRLDRAEEEVQIALESDTLRNQWTLAFTFEDTEDRIRRTFYALQQPGGVSIDEHGNVVFGDVEVHVNREDPFLAEMLFQLFEIADGVKVGAWSSCYASV